MHCLYQLISINIGLLNFLLSWYLTNINRHFLILLFLVFFNVLHGSVLCHLFFLIYTWTTYQMIQYPLSHSFVDDVLWSFIILINAKTWAYELNSNFKNKSEWTLSFYEFRSKQTGSGSRSYIFKENKIISFTNLFQQYIIW